MDRCHGGSSRNMGILLRGGCYHGPLPWLIWAEYGYTVKGGVTINRCHVGSGHSMGILLRGVLPSTVAMMDLAGV